SRVEEIDTLDLNKSLAQSPDSAVPRIAAARPRGRPTMGRRTEPVCFALQGPIVGLACALERCHDILAFVAAQGVGGKNRGFAAQRDNLTPEPLEVLPACLRVG